MIDVFRHVKFEDLGSFAAVLERLQIDFRYIDVPVLKDTDWSALDPLSRRPLIVLGGPMSVHDQTEYPWLVSETEFLGRRIAEGLPTLGICLGAQLIAKAAGARVYPGDVPEIGWAGVTFTGQAAAYGLSVPGAGNSADVLHWHGETFDLPDGGVLLAFNERYSHQAFALTPKILGLQFHLEADYPDLEHWFSGHALEISLTPGVDAALLRDESREKCPALKAWSTAFFTHWLDQCGLL
ncbi:glutamine amidotransferase-related protein [Salinispira pacifica]|uniref:Glutamine amidotransferase class-I n=1 Tax=Salinispira pacifica TaxID=1307761 RepID=V5WLH0_9SPIO|nr:glutamine amidotransferase [Salinispira pacifica]AHC16752.1 Glutamine amidotransferase class-I [Salinispira pacifica]